MGQMTRLAAVNQMLLAAGEAIVSDLETSLALTRVSQNTC